MRYQRSIAGWAGPGELRLPSSAVAATDAATTAAAATGDRPLEELDVTAVSCPDAHSLERLVQSVIEENLPIWSLVFINPRMAQLKNKAPLMEHYGHPVEERVLLPEAYIVTFAFRAKDHHAVVDRIKEKLSRSKHILPPDVHVETAGDLGQVIRTMTNQLKLNALIGAVLVILVLVIGVGFRNSLMIGMAIPFSILIACGVLYAFDMPLTGVAIFSLILW